MDGNTDRRIVRTRLVIRDALTELIEEKGFEAVSVKDITTRANINRGTFYLHYRDKFDLLEQSEAEVIEGIIAIITKATSEDLETYRETGISVSLIVTVFEYIEEHAAFLKAILGPKGDVSFQSQLKAMFRKNLLEKNLSPLIRKENLQVPAEYFLSYVSSAHLGIIQQWLMSGRQETPAEMARILSLLTFRGPFFAAGIAAVSDPKA
ncbi:MULTISPECIES: TetR/AcrR family transcriptional regulator [Paenibacillus]|uniref:TetR/AcrR family transcriptional regulator n=1 Tax=Paenibacillus TaxID=44249 RepID=UPI0011AB47CA|nr:MULTISPECIES: TetR/AcrR family transcriptional regulator [Paenibacillus]